MSSIFTKLEHIYNTTQNNQMDPMADRYISSAYAMLSSNPQIRR